MHGTTGAIIAGIAGAVGSVVATIAGGLGVAYRPQLDAATTPEG